MAHSKLYRNFIILQEDERSKSSSDKALSGYAKIESKGDKCKITFYTQNLKKEDDYTIVLICYKKDLKQIVDIGKLKVSDSGKGEACIEYNSDNIAGLNMHYDKISGAGICKKKPDGLNFTMYGFMSGEKLDDNWKKCKVVKCDYDGLKLKSREYIKREIVEPEIEERSTNIKENIDINENKEEVIKVEVENIKAEHKSDEEEVTNKFEDYERSIEIENVDPYDFKLRGGIGDFFENLVKGFEEVKDGFKELTYTKWYKIPVHDIEDMCDSKDYNKYSILYYPMINYYPYIRKYGYFMMGYKCDKKGNLKYLVYAVPGKKDKDEQPYGGKSGFITWCKRKNSDEYGFWLMFYDYKNSTIVVPSK